MVDWSSFQIGQIWPLWLFASAAVLLSLLWFYYQKACFPDMGLVTRTVTHGDIVDRMPIISGGIIMLLLTLVLMELSFARVVTVEQQARDFLLVFDTSRSMEENTTVPRDSATLHFERRARADESPQTKPNLARYELARESLLSFFSQRRARDRVGLIYFNDETLTMSALTSNIAFLVEQLALMDDYVAYSTDIAKAMESGLNLFARYPVQNKKTLILITDAEASYTKDVEDKLSRLASMGISFYLLWITTDEDKMSHPDTIAFLEYTRSMGTVVTIENLDASNMEDALRDISRLEAYPYKEETRERVDLSYVLFDMTRFLLFGWLLMVITLFHPSKDRKFFINRSKIMNTNVGG